MSRTTDRISEYERKRPVRAAEVEKQANQNTTAWLRRFTVDQNPYLRTLAARQHNRALNKTIMNDERNPA